MSESVLLRKCRSACYHAREGWKQMQVRRQAANRRRAFDTWLKQLQSNRHDVLVGANFAEFGGTRNHMHALKGSSSLNIGLVPDDDSLKKITQWSLRTEFREAFLRFQPQGLRAVHSHVFPWFIEWCYHQQQTNGLRWIHTHHNWYYPEFGANNQLEPWQNDFNEAFLIALSHADVSISVSRWQQAFLQAEFGLKTVYVPNGVDVARCDRADKKRFVRQTGFDDFILWVGRDDPVKNPADFVRLARRLSNLRFVMIGDGLTADNLQIKLGLEIPQNLTVLGGVPHSDVQDAIAACNLLVVTSKREGLPTLVLEAMLRNTPLVVSDEAGCREAVNQGEFAAVYTLGDVDDLEHKTRAMLADGRHAAGSRQFVLQHYDWKVVARQLDQIYSSH